MSDNDRPFLEIAVGVLQAADGRVLIARRRPGTPGAGKWEFPGGKREVGEPMANALGRELAEELGVAVTATRPLLRFTHDYSDRGVLLDIHLVTGWNGEAHGREGQNLAWCMPDRLFDYDLLEANKPVVDALRLPAVYAITPADADDGALVEEAAAVVAAGARLLRLRRPALPDADYEALAASLQPRIAALGGGLLLDRDAAMCRRLGAAGLHWPADRLDGGTRPVSGDVWFAVSCHDRGQLQAALAAGADFATLSPVAATRTHPDAAPLGWPGFAAAREHLALPVYALGGLDGDDLDTARRYGAQGVAGIRAFWPERVAGG